MSESQPPKSQFDPFAAWKPFQEAWAKVMNETVATEDFAKAMGDYLSNYIQTSAPLRQQLEKAVEQYLHQMSLPTRSEVIGLAERLTNLEMRADDLDAKMDELLDHVKAIRAALEARPKTRRKREGEQ